MAIFNTPGNVAKKDTPSFAADVPLKDLVDSNKPADFAPVQPPHAQPAAAQPTPARATGSSSAKESLIASDLSIEGKIEGAGHVRIAGRFKGDVNVQGDLTIEQGAKLAGGVRANQVNVAGELEGNIEQAERVELLASSVVAGDITAKTLTVAAGARIRGHVDCGPDQGGGKPRRDADA